MNTFTQVQTQCLIDYYHYNTILYTTQSDFDKKKEFKFKDYDIER